MSNDFVSLFVEFTKNFESPTSFWKWSAYAAVAATLRFNCCLPWGTSKLYPNLYVLLLADSAVYRKDAPPELVQELLTECAHTKVISGRASWQGIIDVLAENIGNKKTGIPIKHGAGIIIALEFTAMFVEDTSLIKLITEGYSFVSEYRYTLRGGKTTVKDRCITILGGSNETLLRDLYTVEASYGGLLRRTCLIKPDKKRPPNPLMETTDQLSDTNKKVLITKLKDIQNLKGEFQFIPDAKNSYIAWYKDLYNNYDKIEDKSGFVPGMHSLIVKLAMILAAANNSLNITYEIIQRAIKEITDLKANYRIYIMGTGKNPQADISATLLTHLWQLSTNGNHSLKRREILFKYWNEISSEDLDKLILTLEGAGLIRMIPVGNEPAYQLTDLAKAAFLKNEKTKSQSIN